MIEYLFMREEIRDIERLNHILNAINVLIENKDKHTFEEMASDTIVFYGFVKHVEIIGEAVYMLTKEYRDAHPDVEWNAIERMRHVLVHGYYTTSKNFIWATVQQDLPTLRPQIEAYIAEEQAKRGQ